MPNFLSEQPRTAITVTFDPDYLVIPIISPSFSYPKERKKKRRGAQGADWAWTSSYGRPAVILTRLQPADKLLGPTHCVRSFYISCARPIVHTEHCLECCLRLRSLPHDVDGSSNAPSENKDTWGCRVFSMPDISQQNRCNVLLNTGGILLWVHQKNANIWMRKCKQKNDKKIQTKNTWSF